jgi:PAS domain S-box-containing protein
MPVINQPYTLMLAFAAILSAVLAGMILKHRPNLGARSFSVLMTAVSLWAFVSLFEVSAIDQGTKIFSYQIKFLFIVLIPVWWLTFSLYYSNRLTRLQIKHLLLLLIAPAVTLLLVATNSHHQLMFTRFDVIETSGYHLLYPHFGPLFWVHVFYSYALILIGFIFLAKHLIGSQAHYRRQVTYLMVGGVAPWLSNSMFIFKAGPLMHFDLTPVAFCISGVAFMWGILRYKLLDVIPIARDVIVQNMSDGVIVVDQEENIIDLNQRARALTGVRRRNIIGTHAEEIISWWPDWKQQAARSLQNPPPILDLEVDGDKRLLQLNYSPLRNKDKSLGYMLLLQDVTDAKLAEKAVCESEERFKSLSENAPVIIFSLDKNGALSYVNPAWRSLMGYAREETLGQKLANFIPTDYLPKVNRVFNQLVEGQLPTANLHLRFIHKDGTSHVFDTSVSANSDSEGRVTGIIGLAKDVTEEKRLQQQLFQSQKMEAIGTLAGGIAHDFNNLLMGMQANLSLIRLEAAGSPPVGEKIERVEDQIQIGASLTRQLLGYARKGKYAVTVFDLNVLIEETLNVVKRTKKHIIVMTSLSEEPAFIRADQGQMELVLLNLFLNAADAMPNGGELMVTSSCRRGKEMCHPKMESYVEVVVSDTGIGMDQATMDRIFEPFFTTKEMGQGTGLGLASVYGVIKNHSGHIDVRSIPDKGTTFTLHLPADKAVECQFPSREGQADLTFEHTKVLLVDDEALILKYSHEMAASLGLQVISTQDTDDALRLYKDQWSDIDLVIIDMVMPKMDGITLFKAMQAINPQAQAIVTTGYAMDSRISALISDERHACLKKPYTREALASTIRELLSQRCHLAKAAGSHVQ